MDLVLVLPDQLYRYQSAEKIILVEHPDYFVNKHIMKVVFHRATMRAYYDDLIQTGKSVAYVKIADISLGDFNTESVAATAGNFLTDDITLIKYFNENPRRIMKEFYKWQRRRLNILIDSKGEPVGGKWSFDSECREKYPKNYVERDHADHADHYVEEAIKYAKQCKQSGIEMYGT